MACLFANYIASREAKSAHKHNDTSTDNPCEEGGADLVK
jgi:hypothetical protein